MMRLALLASLAAYSLVVSQPLFYLVVLGRAQRALSGPAYVELRQRMNPVMTRRIPPIYLGTLAALLLLVWLSLRAGESAMLVAAVTALACLVIDAVMMLRENQPINAVVDRWSMEALPQDWQDYRTKWFTTFGYRQVVLLVGFASLLAGAVFGA
jgi:hypothetical protein